MFPHVFKELFHTCIVPPLSYSVNYMRIDYGRIFRYTDVSKYFYPRMETTQKNPVDLVDALIVGELLSLPLQLNTKDSLYKDTPEKEAALNDGLEALASHLFAMNEHRRAYKINEKAAWKEFKKEAQKSKVKDTDLTKHVPELEQHIIGFFEQIQPALDSVSQLLNHFLGSAFTGWESETGEDNIPHAGRAIASYIKEHTPEQKKQFGAELEQFIGSNTRWLGYLTTVTAKKDDEGHLTVITPFVFEQKHRTVIPQLYTHSDGYREPVLNFMNRATQELILFTINSLVFAIQISAKDLFLVKAKDRAGHLHYQWVPMEAAAQLNQLQNPGV
jgi:hypothetical protein